MFIFPLDSSLQAQQYTFKKFYLGKSFTLSCLLFYRKNRINFLETGVQKCSYLCDFSTLNYISFLNFSFCTLKNMNNFLTSL